MSGTNSKKVILDRLKEAKSHQNAKIKVKPEKPLIKSEEFLPIQIEVPELEFARNLVNVKGKFTYCANLGELKESLHLLVREGGWNKIFCSEKKILEILGNAEIKSTSDSNLMDCEVAFTGCEYLISRTGSVMVSSAQGSGRRIFGFAPIHVVIANMRQMVTELSDAFKGMKKRYHPLPSQISLITGPSRTADIEKTLVMGAHGPRDFYVFLVNDQSK